MIMKELRAPKIARVRIRLWRPIERIVAITARSQTRRRMLIMTFMMRGIDVVEWTIWYSSMGMSNWMYSQSLVIFELDALMNFMKNFEPIMCKAFRIKIERELLSASIKVYELSTQICTSSKTLHKLNRCKKNMAAKRLLYTVLPCDFFNVCTNKMPFCIASTWVSAKIMNWMKNLRMLLTTWVLLYCFSIKFSL